MNCSVAIPSNGGEGEMDVVLRNWKGKVLDGFARTVSASSSLCGELQAIRAACEMAINVGIKGVVVEADNRQSILPSVSE